MVVYRLSDLDAVGDLGSQSRGLAQGLLADTATRIFYNEPYDEAQAVGKLLGLASVEIGQLPELAQGEGSGGSARGRSWSATCSPPASWPCSTPTPAC
ncbi:MAG: hypothetical protein ACRD0L_03880 [Acidimicrobiales bacterium]